MTRSKRGVLAVQDTPFVRQNEKFAFSAPPQLLDFIESNLWAG